jgi:NTE family protein
MLWRFDRRLLLFVASIILFLAATDTFSQRVGLVLSGGAAKGLAHVGVIKALEENNIPIDYATGTSMGGVIAGCYAAGLSPAQIEEIMLSDDFQRWINGKLEKGYNYIFSKDEDHPSFIRIHLSLDSTLNFNLSSSIANDLSLNFALAEKFTVPSAIAKNNFDSLFVPLRVMASDIFTQSEVNLKSGRLSDALRATHTVPFFYQPIRIDGKYMFDGGVYNNFPVDVMQRDFGPETIIGVNVSSKVYEKYPFEEDESLISKSLLYMLLDKSDPTQIPSNGIYIQPDLSGFSGFDFSAAKSLIDSGYAQTMRQMQEIKSKVSAIRTPLQLNEARKKFLDKGEPFLVDRVRFNGFNSRQRRYLGRFFPIRKGAIPSDKIKSGYYSLISDQYFRNVYPSFTKDSSSRHFQFELNKRPGKNFQVDFGGVISNRNLTSLFLGVNHYYFNRALTHTSLNFYIGNFNKSVQAKTRIDIPLLGRFYLEPEATYNNLDFLSDRGLLEGENDPTILTRTDRRVGARLGFPISQQFKFTTYGYYINNSDYYSNLPTLVSTDTLDFLKLKGWRSGFLLETNDLNRKQYPTAGKNFFAKFDWFSLTEDYEPGSTSLVEDQENHFGWVRFKLSGEQYWKTGVYSTGYFVEGTFSNQPTFSNYFGSIINAPAFYPIQDSHALLLQNFRAFNYVAGGLRNIFSLRPNLDLRLEGYIFKPLAAILPGANQGTRISRELTRVSLSGMAALILHSSVGPISLSLNYYDDKENRLGVLFHLGYLLFQKSSME